MKYWWLEKYKNFKIVQINELANDINYFLTMPKNYIKQYQIIKDKELNILLEEELLIVLKNIVVTKNIKNNNLNIIIDKLLQIPDNSFPPSDYSLEEMLQEIKNLKYNLPYKEKLTSNNIAICYNCLNIFYVDKIKSINKKELCLCPYCLKTKLYFDNDYIPMNYTFLKLAKMYYGISNLGCSFKEIKKILKKNIKVVQHNNTNNNNIAMIDLTDLFSSKIKSIEEKIISKTIYDLLIEKEHNLDRNLYIYIKTINKDVENKLLLLLVSVIDFLTNSIYLKEVNFIFDDKRVSIKFKSLIQYLISN